MNRKRNSLVWRIALPFALLLTLTMAGLSVFVSSYLRESYLDILRTTLQNETRLVAERMQILMQDEPDRAAIDEHIQRYARLLNARITIIDSSGAVIAESHTGTQAMENHLDRPEVQDALRSGIGTELRYSSTLQTEMLYAAAPMLRGKEIVGVARLAVTTRAIRRSEQGLLSSIMGALGAATLLSVLLSFLVAAYTVRPIQQLTRSAQQLAEGQAADTGSTLRQDEIGQLQHALQFMARQLNDQIDELRAERSKLEAVLGNMTDGIIIVDQEGLVRLINPAALRMFQAGAEQAVGRSLVEVARNHQIVDLWRRSASDGGQETVTLELAPERLFIQGIATPLGGSPPGMTLLLFQNLTRVRRLETVRRDFVSNVSHELRTPLASLKALTETLQESALEDPPAARRFLQRMETEIDNLTQMVHELLELSRIESNRFPLQRVSIHPCVLVNPAVERMQLQAERAGLTLSNLCPDDLPPVQADPERIQQVLVNLIHNAIKFTAPGGSITIEARREDSHIVLCVRDTGAGIPSDLLPRIFERFYKADPSRSGGGTGLGLSIARHIIETHGGKIWAESEVNRGSTFYFTLPIG